MRILAFDTCCGYCSVAIYDNQRLTSYLIEDELNQQSKMLLPMIEKALKLSSMNYKDLDYIATNVGPGSFTGIRVALSVAKGLFFTLQKPVVCVSTMESIIEQKMGLVCVSQNAGRGQLYVQKFKDLIKVDEITIIDIHCFELYAKGYEIIGDPLANIFEYSNAQLVAKSAMRKLKNDFAPNLDMSITPLYIRNIAISK